MLIRYIYYILFHYLDLIHILYTVYLDNTNNINFSHSDNLHLIHIINTVSLDNTNKRHLSDHSNRDLIHPHTRIFELGFQHSLVNKLLYKSIIPLAFVEEWTFQPTQLTRDLLIVKCEEGVSKHLHGCHGVFCRIKQGYSQQNHVNLWRIFVNRRKDTALK